MSKSLSLARLWAVSLVSLALTAVSVQAEEMKEISGLKGPKHPVGMAIKDLGKIKLGPEFPTIPEAAHYLMRGRYVTVAAKGTVPVHSHKDRPAITYVLEGELVEYRSDQPKPIVRQAGDITVDDDAIAQWWKNETDKQVKLFVVDFLDPSKSSGH